MSRTITVRLTKELADWLESTAKKTGVAQGKIVRDQLEKHARKDAKISCAWQEPAQKNSAHSGN